MIGYIKHYGTPRHSGRYPWGSGDDPEQRGTSFLGQVAELKKQGMSDVEICKSLGITTSQLRARKSISKAEQRKAEFTQVLRLKDKGISNVAIGERIGRNESYVRSLLDPALQERADITSTISTMLKDQIADKKYLDVGVGVERHLGISRTKLKIAIEMLKDEGYLTSYIPVEQVGTGKKTSMMILSKPTNPQSSEIIRLRNRGLSDTEISKKIGIEESDIKSLLGKAFSEVYNNRDLIKSINNYSEDGGRSFLGLEPVHNIDSKRVMIRYDNPDDPHNSGTAKDGVIELRRGVDELSLGNAKYAQVRIGVDGTHYLKGMAMYTDDLPKGIDVIYNTNKAPGTPKEKVFKEMKSDSEGNMDTDNPFGAIVRQKHYVTQEGLRDPRSSDMLSLKLKGDSYSEIAKKMNVSEDQVRKNIGLSSLNIVNEEGDWGKWSKTLSSQMLSKQTPSLAKRQLGLAYDAKKEEYDSLDSLTNPVVKRKLLESFANDCDSSAVHLKAAALPRQGAHAILPFTTMKETEIYAPNYDNGERVVLIRYPHGGIFEIPELTVNNKHPNAKATIGGAKDAVGINSKVAERLSGADFDGDTVLVIPNPPHINIQTSAPLKGLMNFDPKISYKPYDGMRTIDGGIYDEKTGNVDYGGKSPVKRNKQQKMGDVSNLITDMTIRRANYDEIARAVRHSMVVIDSEKHHLDYAQSYIDNGIAALKKKYQGSSISGASTLISRASSQKAVDYREAGKKVSDPETGKTKRVYVDPNTGEKLYEYTGESYAKKKLNTDTSTMTPEELARHESGKKVYTYDESKQIKRRLKSTKMTETPDAFTLSSGTPMETIYATHANKLKSLANQARKEAINQPHVYQNKSAKEAYAPEVSSLKSKLNIALKNAPLERDAQRVANTIVKSKRDAYPDMEESDVKKVKGQALAEARTRVGAKKESIEITDREWRAIQAGAVSQNVLSQILNNTNLDRVKELSSPRTSTKLSSATIATAKARLASGYTQAEVAASLGISTSTLLRAIKE